MLYDWLRGLHILADIAWMAGLLYLPRLFAYHTRAEPGGEMDTTFKEMESKLLRIIMNPAMIVAWLLGIALIWYDTTYRFGGNFVKFIGEPWMGTKLLGVFVLTGWHIYLASARKRFAAGTNQRTARFWRMTNELPFLTAIVMVLSVTVEWGNR